jgi:hypothetical protein
VRLERTMNTNLGKRLAEHKTSAAGFAKVVVIMLAALAAAAACFALGFEGSGDPRDTGGRVIFFFFGLFASLIALLCIYGLTRGRDNAIRIHEQGIAIRKAGRDTSIPWDDVVSYGAGTFLVIETTNGDAVEFGMDGLRAGDEVLSIVRREVVARRVPQLRRAILEGEAIEFEGAEPDDKTRDPAGHVTDVSGFALDAKGITLADLDRQVPWEAITECGSEKRITGAGRFPVETVSVFIKSATETFHVVIDASGERDVLMALCDEMISDEKGGSHRST